MRRSICGSFGNNLLFNNEKVFKYITKNAVFLDKSGRATYDCLIGYFYTTKYKSTEKKNVKRRENMKKRIVAMIMVAAMAVALAACGSSKSESQSGTGAAPSAAEEQTGETGADADKV